ASDEVPGGFEAFAAECEGGFEAGEPAGPLDDVDGLGEVFEQAGTAYEHLRERLLRGKDLEREGELRFFQAAAETHHIRVSRRNTGVQRYDGGRMAGR